jgi:hypothetical protein
MIRIQRTNPGWVSDKTLHPAIPVPNLDSVFVQLSAKKTYREMERSQKDGVYHCHVMPRLIGLPPYVNEEFRGFKCGRPPKKNAIAAGNRVVAHPPQEARPAAGINWHLVLPPPSRRHS